MQNETDAEPSQMDSSSAPTVPDRSDASSLPLGSAEKRKTENPKPRRKRNKKRQENPEAFVLGELEVSDIPPLDNTPAPPVNVPPIQNRYAALQSDEEPETIPETPAEDQPAGPLTPVLFTPTQSSTVPPVNVQLNVMPPFHVPPTTDQPHSNPPQPTAAQVDPTVTPVSGHVPLKSILTAATRAAFGRRVAKPSNINIPVRKATAPSRMSFQTQKEIIMLVLINFNNLKFNLVFVFN